MRFDPAFRKPNVGGNLSVKTKRLLVALAVAGAAFGIASAVEASIPDSSGVAHGCYYVPPKLGGTQQRPGDLRLIDTDKGQQCAADEQSVDLATTQYVQSVVATAVNQTSGEFADPLNYNVTGDWQTTWTCDPGYVAIDPWVQSNEYFGHNHYLTVKSEANLGSLAGGPPSNQVRIYYNISTGVPWSYMNGVTCVDGRVYGQPGPAKPIAPDLRATAATSHLD